MSTSSYGVSKFNGTSAATPHVAGMAALLLDQNPTLTLDDLAALLAQYAFDKGDTGKDNLWGEGIAMLLPLGTGVAVVAPSHAAPELVGSHSEPVKTYVTVSVTGLSGSSLDGLLRSVFVVHIGDQVSDVISVREIGDEYLPRSPASPAGRGWPV